jgi:hypothetical protein
LASGLRGNEDAIPGLTPDSFQQNVHAIGDRANHIVLDIFEDMQSKDPGFLMDRRPRIEHSQIMTLDDLDRSGRLGGKGCPHLHGPLFTSLQSLIAFNPPTRRSTHEAVLLIADNSP